MNVLARHFDVVLTSAGIVRGALLMHGRGHVTLTWSTYPRKLGVTKLNIR
jgi:hypothetical protein